MTPVRYCTTDDDTTLQKLMCNEEVSCSSMEEFQRELSVVEYQKCGNVVSYYVRTYVYRDARIDDP